MIICFSMTSNRPRDLDVSFGIDCFAPVSFLISSMAHYTSSFPRMVSFMNWLGVRFWYLLQDISLILNNIFDLTFYVFFLTLLFHEFWLFWTAATTASPAEFHILSTFGLVFSFNKLTFQNNLCTYLCMIYICIFILHFYKFNLPSQN